MDTPQERRSFIERRFTWCRLHTQLVAQENKIDAFLVISLRVVGMHRTDYRPADFPRTNHLGGVLPFRYVVRHIYQWNSVATTYGVFELAHAGHGGVAAVRMSP